MRNRISLLLLVFALLSCGDRDTEAVITKHWRVEIKSLSDSSTVEVDTLQENGPVPPGVAGRERLYRVDSVLTSMDDSLASVDNIELSGEAYPVSVRALGEGDGQHRLYHVVLQLIPNSSLTAEYVFSQEHGVLEEVFPHAKWEMPVRYRLLRSERSSGGTFAPNWEDLDSQLEHIDEALRLESDLFEQAGSGT